MFGSSYKCELAHLKYSGKNQTSTNENANKECNICPVGEIRAST
jgi:hypothetical protein